MKKKISPAMVKKAKKAKGVVAADKLDKKMDKQRGTKQGSKADKKMDSKVGVAKLEYSKDYD